MFKLNECYKKNEPTLRQGKQNELCKSRSLGLEISM